jgi:probable rRNA maturation factor
MAPGDQRRARPRLQVSASDERGRALGGSLARWLSEVAPARARGSVAVAVVTDARVRALNRQYRKKDYATDVLSFPAQGAAPRSRGPSGPRMPRRLDGRQLHANGNRFDAGRHGTDTRAGMTSGFSPTSLDQHLGDIVIARGVARRQAKAAGHPEATELRVLALHGLLHLLGYDHEADQGEMAQLEKRLRRKGGLREGLIERQ